MAQAEDWSSSFEEGVIPLRRGRGRAWSLLAVKGEDRADADNLAWCVHLADRGTGVFELELESSLDTPSEDGAIQSVSHRSAAVEAQARALGFELPPFGSQALPVLREAVFKFFEGIEKRLKDQCQLLQTNPQAAYEVLIKGLEANLANAEDEGVKEDFTRFLGIAAQHMKEIAAASGQPNCVRIRLNKLKQYTDVCGMFCKGFDEKSDPEDQLLALPTSASNSDGLRLFATVIEALDALADSEGKTKREAAHMSLMFQSMANVLLEHHNLVEPRWMVESEAVDEEAMEAVKVLDSLAIRG